MACFSDSGVIIVAIFKFFAESDLIGMEAGFSKFYWLENRLIMSEQATLSFGLPTELIGPSDMNLVENDSLMGCVSTLSFLRVDWLEDLS